MKKTNVVLIGLPGAGKTTIGKQLSAVLDMPFTDSDENIVRNYGQISELFLKGEEYFRDIENKMILRLSTLERTIISTGGGVVLNPLNIEALERTGYIFYIKRSVEDILRTTDLSNRPLLKSSSEKLYRLYEERNCLYENASDYLIDATHIRKAINTIISIWSKLS